MSTFLKSVWRINCAYDDLPEPRRFLAFMLVVLIPLSVLQVAAPLAFVAIAAPLAWMRVAYLHRGRRQ